MDKVDFVLLNLLWFLLLAGVALGAYSFGWWWRGEHERKLAAERLEHERRYREWLDRQRQVTECTPRLTVVK